MKKAFTLAMTLLLSATLVFAQDTGGDKGKTAHKATKTSKAHKGGKKSKKGSTNTTTPPPK